MDDGRPAEYPPSVLLTIPQEQPDAYRAAADRIRAGRHDVLCVQHEYGIFGGEAGGLLLHLLNRVDVPVVVTLHTVLKSPGPAQKQVLDAILRRADRVVVMSTKAVSLLEESHAVDLSKVSLIPHGIPAIDGSEREATRARFGVKGPLLLTFGLLSPDKGLQYAIRAMPRILAEHPEARYLIVGATHPQQASSHGETYRRSLEQTVADLGLGHAVTFVDRFVPKDELTRLLGAMDVYITPYLKQDQITSGTLAYSMGAGKAVVSTPYWYAEETLADGRGCLVPFQDSDAIAEAVLGVFAHPEQRESMSQAAATFAADMLWPSVADRYLQTFRSCQVREALVVGVPSPSPNVESGAEAPQLDHLLAMTDDTGLLQHATFTFPNRAEGYCVDDNARALLFTTQCEAAGLLSPVLAALQRKALAFVLHAQHPLTGRFRNFMDYTRRWLEEAGSEDSHGRSMWCLAAAMADAQDPDMRDAAAGAWRRGLPSLMALGSPRSWAYGTLGLGRLAQALPGDLRVRASLSELASRLMAGARKYGSPEWPWFEASLSYANPRLCQALLVAGHVLGDERQVEQGLGSLDWLADLQCDDSDRFSPVGTDGLRQGEHKTLAFDQQPIEAWTMVSAALTALHITQDAKWIHVARRAFGWFHRENALGLPIYDASTGGCRDGLHADRVSRNQGAESTLAYLCSLVELQAGLRSAASPLPVDRSAFVFVP